MSTDQILDSPVLQGSFEVIDGLELFVRRTDPATNEADVVMVHGLGGMSTNWTDLMHLQSDRGRRCVALDLPGFGRSEADPEGDYCSRGTPLLSSTCSKPWTGQSIWSGTRSAARSPPLWPPSGLTWCAR